MGNDQVDVYSVAPRPGDQFLAGTFRRRLEDERWTWSDEMYRIHGYERGDVVPTTDLVLSHKHPTDRIPAAETIRRSLDSGRPFSHYHRIIDAAGRVRQVLSVGEGIRNDAGLLLGVHGFMIDLSGVIDGEVRESAATAVAEARRNSAVIEQAKGALMLYFGVPAEEAFSLLAARSQQTNTKLAALAERIVVSLPDQSDARRILEIFNGDFPL